MVRDIPSQALPNGAVYDSLNLLNDVPGIMRQRGGTTSLGSTAAAFCQSIGWAYSKDATTIEQLYGIDGKGEEIYAINSTTGASTALASLSGGSTFVAGRPVAHFGFLTFPYLESGGTRRNCTVAGQGVAGAGFTNAATVSVSAGNQQLTLSGSDTTTNVKVGAVIWIDDTAASLWYFGRVVSVDSSKLFTVWPTPTWTNAAVSIGFVTTFPNSPLSNSKSGLCAASFQNRLLYGNCMDLGSTNQSLIADRRVYYSPLPTELTPLPSAPSIFATGASYGATNFWPLLNFFDIPGSDPIVAMEPISDGELVIFTGRDLIIFEGNLVTELATTSPTITWDVYPLDTTYGCLSDLSVQRTPVGIMWAGNEGVFAYWPPLRKSPAKTGVRNLMSGKIQNYWTELTSHSDFAIHGAAYVRNHYVVSGFANGATFGLAVNVMNDDWTRLSGAGTDIFNGASRPSVPQQVFAARWWDQTGAAPSMTNGQVVRLESMFNPYVAGASKTDADGSTVPVSVTSRVITAGGEDQLLFQRGTVRYQQSSTTAACTVTAQSKIDAADIDASSVRSLGSLSSTATGTITNATNANPITVTTSAAHGLQTDDFVDVDAVGGNVNANGRWRIAVTGSTTFTLVGGIGNAAYTSGGKVKKLTESDFTISSLNAGQGASLTIAGSPNNFELHGIALDVLAKQPVMSA